MQHSFAWLLLAGILIRLPALWHPVEEGQRNAQTACLTANMFEDGRLRLDPIAPWRGDLEARLVQELPIYNLAVLALQAVTGFSLDLAGRLISLLFWVLSLFLLQMLWRRTLSPPAHFWANLLFVVAPMGWYLSTAFMPEMLVQALSFAFLLLVLRYADHPTWQTLGCLTLVGALGLLVKLPAFTHLGLFLGLVLVDRQGWRGLLRPELWTAGLLIGVALLAWSHFVDEVNTPFFPDWRGWENLRGFVRPETSRLSFNFWAPLVAYNLAFILPVAGAPFAVLGLKKFWHDRDDFYYSRVWLYLLLSLLGSWLVWAKGAAAQNYYNLPNLVFFSAAFGAGMEQARRVCVLQRWRPLRLGSTEIFVLSLVALSGVAGAWYLAKPDKVALRAAHWVKTHTQSTDLILYQPRHNAAVLDYEHQPLLSLASARRSWIWTKSTPAWEKARAGETAGWLVVTQPPEQPAILEKLRRFFKGQPSPVPPILTEEQPAQWELVTEAQGFAIYRRSPLPRQGTP